MISRVENGNVGVDTENNRVEITVDRSLYPLDALYGAAYIFIDRCFVLLDSPDETTLRVWLSGRETLDADALRTLAGEFGNELLAQTWRRRVVEQNRPVIEAVSARAFSGALPPSPVEALDDLDLSGDAFDDPLGIAVPWEEKYGKKGGEETGSDAGKEKKTGASGPGEE
jgi:His-Xaa-Ser system protein HxsD